MKAVVMAGGQGSRLRPLTIGRPKPMVPLVNKPVLAHSLELLKRHGIREVVLTLQHMADVIQDYFGDGQELGMRMDYSIESVPLGTAGSVRQAAEHLGETFWVISGDALTDFDLGAILDFHRRHEALATLVLYRVPDPLEYGVVITDSQGRIRQFLEKPSGGEVISDTVNTGIYVLEPEALQGLEPGKSYDFSKEVFPRLLERGEEIYGFVAEGYWTDVGNLNDYRRASFDLLEGRVRDVEIGRHLGGNVWVGGEVEIAPDAQLYGPIYLGNGVKIKGGVVVRGPSVIRDNTILDTRAQIDRSIIWRNSYVGEGVELRGALVGKQVVLKSRAMVFEGAVIGDNSIVGEGSIIHAEVKIWPEKEIEAGAIVKSSLIWGAQGRRVLFGRFGVTGLVNLDLTPEFAAKLGAAFGTVLPLGSTVTMNRDPHRSPRMIKRAMISGLPSAGIHVSDLGNMPIPVARYITRISAAAGGVHVRLSPFDNRVVDIRFFDERGRNLSKAKEREIERVFFREEFRRVYLGDVGTIAYAPQVVERYAQGFMAAVNADIIRPPRFRLVVDYAHAPTSLVLPSLLNILDCDVVALNARIDESKMSILPEEFQAALHQLAQIASAVRPDLGVRLDVGGEKIFLVDDGGRVLSGIVATAALAELALRQHPGGTIVVPVHLPSIFERIATQHQGRVVRCRVDPQAFMSAAAEEGAILAGDGTGDFIYAPFHEAPDGLMATVKLLEYLAAQGTKLSEVVNSLPQYHLAERRVSCPWEAKGTVMRRLNEQYRPPKADQGPEIEGVRIQLGEEWVLVRPDPDAPLIHIHAEASSQSGAQELAEKYARIVESLQS
ncbi:MAG: mannose-1-phosphate guanyltransferase [Chloroflexi bacterium]|nr:mannose-1-phosphate guanyltransferase [Chloroflexota bacterium]